jgi:hypothetical protein
LGGHLERCDQCGHERNAYNSCANRHCPKCQSLARAEWLKKRQAELLRCEYFHVVFTLPQQLAAVALQNKREMYGLLFRAAAETLQEIASDPQHLGAHIGFFCILHTWGQTLSVHPHLHCVVPGGGISLDGSRWVSCRRPDFLLPVRVLSDRFRNLYLRYLEESYAAGKLRFYGKLHQLSDPKNFARHLAPLRGSKWVVYAKPPFGGPERVLDYLGRYTHRVAISNHRLKELKQGHVTFTYKDYKHEHRQKVMTLSADEFLRRFLMHVLLTASNASAITGFSAIAAGPGIWPTAENCWPCRSRHHHRLGIFESVANNSAVTIRFSARSARVARWCESASSPQPTSFQGVTAHDQCNST